MKVLVLGGAGRVGHRIAELLVARGVGEVARADRAAPTDDLQTPFIEVDVSDNHRLASVLGDHDLVVNTVGPYDRWGTIVLDAAIEAGIDYVDICDDLDATRALLDLDGAARAAGVQALVGMGSSPGIANVFVKLCAEQLLDTVTSADIMHIHGGEPSEGAAVLKHRVHAMVNDVPLFADGRFVDVRMLEASGEAFVRTEDFPGLGPHPVFPYPHPETITLPATFPSLRRATNLGVVFPLSYFRRTQDLVRAGLGGDPARQS